MKKTLVPKPLVKAEKAYKNPGFLNSKNARPVRILAEFLEPLSRFEYFNVKDTVVFFGSARTKPKATAEKEDRKSTRLNSSH